MNLCPLIMLISSTHIKNKTLRVFLILPILYHPKFKLIDS